MFRKNGIILIMNQKRIFIASLVSALVFMFVYGLISYIQSQTSYIEIISGGVVFFIAFYLVQIYKNKKKK